MSVSCYARNGTAEPSHVLPCNATAIENNQHSACCSNKDLCLTNGMCKNADDEKNGANIYFRVGCTDPTFQDPACPQYCPNRERKDSLNAIIFNCLKERSWCCAQPDAVGGGINTECCDKPELTFTADNPLIYATAIRSIPVSSTATSSIATSLPSETPTNSSSPSSNSNSNANSLRLGLGVGLSVGLVLIAALVGLLMVLRSRRKRAALEDRSLGTNKPDPSISEDANDYKKQDQWQFGTATSPAEVQGTVLYQELPADARDR